MITQSNTNNKGTFLQVPDVYLQTCDLPDSAQVLFLRLWDQCSYKGFFLGSIRKLAKIVRLSKSTVDRMLKVLKDSPLITIEPAPDDEQDRTVMKITINTCWLWDANQQYITSNIVPIWDTSNKEKKVKHCPKLGRTVPEKDELSQNGTLSPKLGRTVPDVSSKVPPYISKTILDQLDISKIVGDASPVVFNDANTPTTPITEKEPPFEETTTETEEITPAVSKPVIPPPSPEPTKPERPGKGKHNRNVTVTEKPAQPTPLALESEKELAFWDLWCTVWFNKDVPPALTDTAKGHVKKLAGAIISIEQLNSLIAFARKELEDRNIKQKAVQLGNLVNSHPRWKQTQSNAPGEAPKKEIGKMSQEELQDYALSFPPRLDHHSADYKDLQRCLDRLLPDLKKEVVRKRFEVQHQTAAIAS